MKNIRSCLPGLLLLVIFVGVLLLVVIVIAPAIAWQSFGPSAASLNAYQRVSYALDLVVNASDLTQPRDMTGAEQVFTVQPGESVSTIASRLEGAGLIRNARTFRTYLIWTGLDTIIMTGAYHFSPTQTGRDIAQSLKSTTLTDITLTVLPGWRMEEITASLPTSGLLITPEDFMAAASAPANAPDFLARGKTAEGFLCPGTYTLSRSTSADQLVHALLQGFSSRLTPELLAGFANHGFSVYQAVTLASIIQREIMVEDEMPMIASVFYNRLAAGMPLQTDPTIQYALGYNSTQRTWWTNPLSLDDLKVDSPYNTYINTGLPPGPISNPGLSALQAVAFPAQSNYLFFQARCDGSGRHVFAETFEQHQSNDCP